jgi:aralkylamine N-acetyltransferase
MVGSALGRWAAKMSIEYTEDPKVIDWERLANVFKSTPLGNRDPDKLREAFQNSAIRCFVWDAEELIGAGRAISDGVRYSLILDVVLLPEYQGRGIGKRIMELLAERSKGLNILLYAMPGKEGFYSKLGYRKMKTAMAQFTNPETMRKNGFTE